MEKCLDYILLMKKENGILKKILYKVKKKDISFIF